MGRLRKCKDSESIVKSRGDQQGCKLAYWAPTVRAASPSSATAYGPSPAKAIICVKLLMIRSNLVQQSRHDLHQRKIASPRKGWPKHCAVLETVHLAPDFVLGGLGAACSRAPALHPPSQLVCLPAKGVYQDCQPSPTAEFLSRSQRRALLPTKSPPVTCTLQAYPSIGVTPKCGSCSAITVLATHSLWLPRCAGLAVD